MLTTFLGTRQCSHFRRLEGQITTMKRRHRLYIPRSDYLRYEELLCSIVDRCEGDRYYISQDIPDLIVDVVRAFMLGHVSFYKSKEERR